MKIYLGQPGFGWRMYGILGKDAMWFFGFSRAVPEELREFNEQREEK